MNKFLGGTLLGVALNIATPTNAYGQDSQFNLQNLLDNPDDYSIQLYSDREILESRKIFLDCVQSIIESGSNNFAPCLLPGREVHITNRGEICDMQKGFSKEVENKEGQEEELLYTPIPDDYFIIG